MLRQFYSLHIKSPMTLADIPFDMVYADTITHFLDQ